VRLRIAHQRHPVESARQTPFAARGVVAGIAAVDARLERRFHVGARAEAAPRAGDDDGADLAICIGTLDRVGEFDAHAGRPGVQAIGAVQREQRDLVAAFDGDLFVLHGGSSFRASRGWFRSSGRSARARRRAR
jgi:hypothetical protein